MYNYYFELYSFIFLSLFALYFYSNKRLYTKQTRYYAIYLSIGIVDIGLNLLTCHLYPYGNAVPLTLRMLFNGLYLFLQLLLPTIIVYYIHSSIHLSRKKHYWYILVFTPVFIGAVLLILNNFNQCMFYFDESGAYKYGPLHSYLYVGSACYVFYAIFYLIRYFKCLSKGTRIALFGIILNSFILIGIQYAYPVILMTGTSIMIDFLIMYLSFENPWDYIDNLTSLMNRKAFCYFMQKIDFKNEPKVLYTVSLNNFKIVNDIFGNETGDEIVKLVSEKLVQLYGGANVFRYSGDIFLVLLPVAKENSVHKEMEQLFKDPWFIGSTEIILSASICETHSFVLQEFRERIIKVIDYGIVELKRRGSSQYLQMDLDEVKRMIREEEIELVLRRAIDNRSFEVYYQPILTVKEKKFSSAEALVRLIDPEYGFISPGEFIPLAEKNGLILQIGDIVFEKVCQFIKENNIEQYGIKYIEVNLSVVECMQNKLYERLLNIMDKYKVDYKLVNFEVTETVAIISGESVINNMEKLIERGAQFSLDDFGSGFSNFANVMKLPFRIVKIDKSMVWEAMASERIMNSLKYIILMIKDLNMEIVAEGVENPEQADTLENLGCDHFQGFYYSKPLPGEQFISFLVSKRQKNVQ